jgi:replicative DNA helicase
MRQCFDKMEPIDILSVSSKLKENGQLEGIGGSAYLTSLINMVPTATHVANYAKIVREKKVLRDLNSSLRRNRLAGL